MKRRVSFLFIFLFAACSNTTSSQSPVESMETTDRVVIEENTDILLPQSANELHGYLEGFRETTFYMKFSMSPDDQDALLESSVCEMPLKDRDYPLSQSDYLDFLGWWTPENAEIYLWCSGIKDHAHQSIFIDTTNHQKYIVYIVDAWY